MYRIKRCVQERILRVWSIDHLLKRLISIEGIQVLFTKIMWEWPPRHFRDLPSKLESWGQEKHPAGPQDLLPRTTLGLCSHIPQCSLFGCPSSSWPRWSSTATLEDTIYGSWQHPCSANSSGLQSTWVVGPWLPPFRFQRMLWLPVNPRKTCQRGKATAESSPG